MNRSIVKFMVAAAMVGVTLMMAGCGGGEEKKRAEMGPEETVEAFCRAVAGGEFAAAKALCDTVAMKPYIDSYAVALASQTKKDGGAAAIATETLSMMEFTTDDIIKDGDSRKVHYTIAGPEGMNKKKTATVKRIEGVWKVEEITDRP